MVEIKYMPISEFRSWGLLQEINRQFLHPRGLALEIIIDKETGEEKFGGVWDYRDDPEGIIFGEGEISPGKAGNAAAMLDQHQDVRLEKFGWMIQPVFERNKE